MRIDYHVFKMQNEGDTVFPGQAKVECYQIPEALILELENAFSTFPKPTSLHYGIATHTQPGNVDKKEDAQIMKALGFKNRDDLKLDDLVKLFKTYSDFLLTDEAFFYFLPAFVRFGCEEGGDIIWSHLMTRIRNSYNGEEPLYPRTLCSLTEAQLKILKELDLEERKSPLSW